MRLWVATAAIRWRQPEWGGGVGRLDELSREELKAVWNGKVKIILNLRNWKFNRRFFRGCKEVRGVRRVGYREEVVDLLLLI